MPPTTTWGRSPTASASSIAATITTSPRWEFPSRSSPSGCTWIITGPRDTPDKIDYKEIQVVSKTVAADRLGTGQPGGPAEAERETAGSTGQGHEDREGTGLGEDHAGAAAAAGRTVLKQGRGQGPKGCSLRERFPASGRCAGTMLRLRVYGYFSRRAASSSSSCPSATGGLLIAFQPKLERTPAAASGGLFYCYDDESGFSKIGRPGHRRHSGPRHRPRPDGRLHERRGLPQDGRDRLRHLLQPLAAASCG